MNYLQALEKRGVTARRMVNNAVALSPKESLTPKIRTVVREHKAEIIAEIHAALLASVESTERAILAQLASDAITQDDAEAQLTYLFRTTTAEPMDIPPCPACGETMHWWHRGEDDGLPPVCYSCKPPPEDAVAPVMFEAVGL